jgi:hypothetical protein
MPPDILPSVNDAEDLPKWESICVFLGELGQVSGRYGEKPRHDAAALAIDAMTYGTVILVLDFSTSDHLGFLRQDACC